MFQFQQSTVRASMLAALIMGGLFAAVPMAAAEDKTLVLAAASLKNALDKVNSACASEAGGSATISYGATPALAKQLEEGAPADLFFSADLDWMKKLSGMGLIKEGSETKLLGNELVLVAPVDSKAEIAIAQDFDLAGLIGAGKLAMANVESVPAGKYGKASLETLGVWDKVKDKVAQAENVRAALALVATGEAALGIVYTTDAKVEKKVKVIGRFPDDTHPPIVYPVAQTASSKAANAPALLKCLTSAKSAEIFKGEGFTVLAPSK